LGDGVFNIGSEENLTVLNISKLVAERASKILKKKVDVSTDQKNKNIELNPLIFNIQKLKNTGFRLRGELIDEIDQTLMFCKKFF